MCRESRPHLWSGLCVFFRLRWHRRQRCGYRWERIVFRHCKSKTIDSATVVIRRMWVHTRAHRRPSTTSLSARVLAVCRPRCSGTVRLLLGRYMYNCCAIKCKCSKSNLHNNKSAAYSRKCHTESWARTQLCLQWRFDRDVRRSNDTCPPQSRTRTPGTRRRPVIRCTSERTSRHSRRPRAHAACDDRCRRARSVSWTAHVCSGRVSTPTPAPDGQRPRCLLTLDLCFGRRASLVCHRHSSSNCRGSRMRVGPKVASTRWKSPRSSSSRNDRSPDRWFLKAKQIAP